MKCNCRKEWSLFPEGSTDHSSGMGTRKRGKVKSKEVRVRSIAMAEAVLLGRRRAYVHLCHGDWIHCNAEIAKHCFPTAGKEPRQQPHQHTLHKTTGTKPSPVSTILKNLQRYLSSLLWQPLQLLAIPMEEKKTLALKTKTKTNPQQTSQDWDQEITAENSSPACRLIK